MLFAGWVVRMLKNCDRGLENAARGRRPRAAFSSPRSQFFTIRTDPKPANNMATDNERVTQMQTKKDVLKNRLFSNYFMLAAFISPVKFSKMVFAV